MPRPDIHLEDREQYSQILKAIIEKIGPTNFLLLLSEAVLDVVPNPYLMKLSKELQKLTSITVNLE